MSGGDLELLVCIPPIAMSFQRADSASLSGPILQPQEVEATAAVDQSATTEGGLAEGVLPAGQTLSPQPGASGFPKPQNCPRGPPTSDMALKASRGDLRRWMEEERRRAWGA